MFFDFGDFHDNFFYKNGRKLGSENSVLALCNARFAIRSSVSLSVYLLLLEATQ